jgi:SAM-dependent methyltransferase
MKTPAISTSQDRTAPAFAAHDAITRPSGYGVIVPAGGDTAAPLNVANRLHIIRSLVQVAGKRVLDCGCGSGEYVRSLVGLGARAWGVELSGDKLRLVPADLKGRVVAGDLAQVALGDAAVDITLLNEVLEHVPDDRQVLREMHRILKPGGTLVIFSPNRCYPFETHGAFLGRSDVRLPHYVPFVPYIPLVLSTAVLRFWARNYWPGELRRLVRGCGFSIIHTDYVWQTFEGLSHHQPRLLSWLSPVFRRISAALERIPLVRSLGVSQVIIAIKKG